MSTFYARLPKAITDLSAELRKVIETDSRLDCNQIMTLYFKQHWSEFRDWWRKTQSEQIDWVTFVLSPANAEFFTQYCFQKYPDCKDAIRKALDDYYLMSKPADKQTERRG